jgi:iron-sulfur cluster assembly protein
MITFTDAAVEQIKEFSKNHPTAVLRVGVSGGGCSGFEYKLGFIEEEEVDETFSRYKQKDLPFVVDEKSEPFIDGCTVDWVEDLMQKGFRFDNPNATGSCGCKKSFSV